MPTPCPVSASIRNELGAHPTPIFKLHKDILSTVFSLNADMLQAAETSIPALVTLRRTSQVCSSWRTFIIESPLLWARVLNFRSLLQEGGEWRKEVVLRTGAALLHIKWDINESDTEARIEPFLRQMVEENWPRIQKLDLHFRSDIQAEEHEEWLDILQRPAPSLEEFRLISKSWPAPPQDLNFVFFSNHAPSLSTLSLHNLNIKTTISIPNIRRLVLNSSMSAQTSEFLYALREMPLIEDLCAMSSGSFVQSGSKDTLPQVILPQLKSINLVEAQGADDSLSLLAHIIPAKRCIFVFTSSYAAEIPSQISLQLCRDVLSRYLGYSTEQGSATHLDVLLSDNVVTFSVHRPFGCVFVFILLNSAGNFTEHDIPILLSALTTIQLDKITKSELCVALSIPMHSNPDIIKYVHAFGSLEELKTNCTTLNALALIQSKTKVVTFPALKIINLGEVTTMHDILGATVFFDQRISLGFPVDGITLKMKPVGVNFDTLEGVQGLTIEVENV